MKHLAFVQACCLMSLPLSMAQSGTSGSYNPYLIQGTLTPAPLPPTEFGGGGTLLFDVGNTGSSDLPAVANQEMRLTITLSRMVPATADPLAAIGGEGAAWFHWSYDSSIRTYTGTQKTTIPNHLAIKKGGRRARTFSCGRRLSFPFDWNSGIQGAHGKMA